MSQVRTIRAWTFNSVEEQVPTVDREKLQADDSDLR